MSKDVNAKIQTALGAISSLEQKMLSIEKSQKNKTFTTWVLLVAGFVAVILLCKK